MDGKVGMQNYMTWWEWRKVSLFYWSLKWHWNPMNFQAQVSLWPAVVVVGMQHASSADFLSIIQMYWCKAELQSAPDFERLSRFEQPNMLDAMQAEAKRRRKEDEEAAWFSPMVAEDKSGPQAESAQMQPEEMASPLSARGPAPSIGQSRTEAMARYAIAGRTTYSGDMPPIASSSSDLPETIPTGSQSPPPPPPPWTANSNSSPGYAKEVSNAWYREKEVQEQEGQDLAGSAAASAALPSISHADVMNPKWAPAWAVKQAEESKEQMRKAVAEAAEWGGSSAARSDFIAKVRNELSSIKDPRSRHNKLQHIKHMLKDRSEHLKAAVGMEEADVQILMENLDRDFAIFTYFDPSPESPKYAGPKLGPLAAFPESWVGRPPTQPTQLGASHIPPEATTQGQRSCNTSSCSSDSDGFVRPAPKPPQEHSTYEEYLAAVDAAEAARVSFRKLQREVIRLQNDAAEEEERQRRRAAERERHRRTMEEASEEPSEPPPRPLMDYHDLSDREDPMNLTTDAVAATPASSSSTTYRSWLEAKDAAKEEREEESRKRRRAAERERHRRTRGRLIEKCKGEEAAGNEAAATFAAAAEAAAEAEAAATSAAAAAATFAATAAEAPAQETDPWMDTIRWSAKQKKWVVEEVGRGPCGYEGPIGEEWKRRRGRGRPGESDRLKKARSELDEYMTQVDQRMKNHFGEEGNNADRFKLFWSIVQHTELWHKYVKMAGESHFLHEAEDPIPIASPASRARARSSGARM